MSLYVVTRVNFSGNEISTVEIGEADPTNGSWKKPDVQNASKVLALLDAGHTVTTVVPTANGGTGGGPGIVGAKTADGRRTLGTDTFPADAMVGLQNVPGERLHTTSHRGIDVHVIRRMEMPGRVSWHTAISHEKAKSPGADKSPTWETALSEALNQSYRRIDSIIEKNVDLFGPGAVADGS